MTALDANADGNPPPEAQAEEVVVAEVAVTACTPRLSQMPNCCTSPQLGPAAARAEPTTGHPAATASMAQSAMIIPSRLMMTTSLRASVAQQCFKNASRLAACASRGA